MSSAFENKINLLPDVFDFDDSLKKESEIRIENSKTKSPIGVSYFDHAIGGIYANDVLLIGAKSGVGKTELATQIALTNALNGRRVLYFALEAEMHEIARRIKFKYVSEYFYENKNQFENQHLRYQDWYYYKYGNMLDVADRYADSKLSFLKENLKTIYRTDTGYTANDFKKHFFALKDSADMFIVDHVHYFDSDEPNENKALKDAMKSIRDCALNGNKPIVLVAHMRKSDARMKTLVPELDDFHGSSDLAKIATKAIAIAPAKDQERKKSLYPTYMKVLKCRVGSDSERFSALGYFDISKNKYAMDYVIGHSSGDSFKEIDDESEKPQWAKKKKITNQFGEVLRYEGE